ncbi:MAG: twin-arginine translocation signal domain-containing protein [Deltaproteobacteria bacterium]|nr:MAG: twin-arginine translocation signal domain-containing protein [Deltaproteobacteria bacterium]
MRDQTNHTPADEREERRGLNRRQFMAASAVTGGAVAVALSQRAGVGEALAAKAGDGYPLSHPEAVIHSVCLQCHNACPIKCKVYDGVLAKIDGNPYGPQTMLPHLAYDTPLDEAAKVDGKLCPKGQAGIQTLYDPYRIRSVLKRAGKRGENKWVTIPFDQAIDEIVNGGKLFANVPGEEQREVPGLKDIYKARDPAVMKAMGSDAKAVAKGALSLDEFKARHAAHLDVLIDPDHPDLGPVNNQFCFLAGRIEHGRKEFAKRFMYGGFGSKNWYEHTTVCEQSHHIAYDQATKGYAGGGKWGKGKHHFKPDSLHSTFIVYFGTSPFEANFGPTNMTERIVEGIANNRTRIVVVDPRAHHTAAKAWKWLPLRPGTDAAVALAMGKVLMDEGRFDQRFLENANQAAANADGELSWSTASWLVRIDEHGEAVAYLRASDVGLGDSDSFVVSRGGQLVAFTPKGGEAVEGDLFVEGEANGHRYVSALALYRAEADKHSVAEWCELAGVDADDLIEVARELSRHGKTAAVEMYRGPVQHTSGFYNGLAIIMLNVLLGNIDWQGGMMKGGGHWHEDGSKHGPFNLVKGLHPGKLPAWGIKVNREGIHFEDTTLFTGNYPAKRPFYPFTGNLYQEVLPSAAMGYPYPLKALMLHKGTPVFSVPGGQKMIEYIADPERLPLFFACDITVGETSMYCDYIFPDTAIWERWGTPHQTPDVAVAGSKVRQPVVTPLVDTCTVFGVEQPINMESVMLAIAEKLQLPGYGPGGFAEGGDFRHGEDWYLRMVANIAKGDKEGDEVAPADEEEMRIFMAARAHLSKAVFDADRWRKAVGDEWWPRVVTVLNRGGRFEAADKGWKPPYVAHAFKGQFNVFAEPVASTRNSMSGRRFSGVAHYEPPLDCKGDPVDQGSHALALITNKDILGGHSRTPGNYWTQTYRRPENKVVVAAEDAEKLGLRDGQAVRIVSPSNPEGVWDLKNGQKKDMVGQVEVSQLIRPGTINVSWHYGHWAYGATDIVVDGQVVPGERRRGKGLCANAALMLDPVLGDVCLTDPIGGSTSFYDSRVSLVPV